MEHLHTCLACGNAPTIHFMEKFSAFVDTEVSPWFRPLDTLRRRIEPLVNPALDKLELLAMGACNTLHIGKFLDRADHRTPMRAVCFWESAKKRGIHMYEFRLFGRPFDLYIATYKDRVIVFDGLPRPGTHSSASLDWMDDKAIIHKRFSATGIPVAMGGVARSKRQAIEIFTKTPHPVIIKPNIGSRSRHTTIHITTEADLVRAYRCAKELSPWVIVEQELTGRVYRATVIGGSVVGVLRRDPAHASATDTFPSGRSLRSKKNRCGADPYFICCPSTQQVRNIYQSRVSIGIRFPKLDSISNLAIKRVEEREDPPPM